MSALDLGSNSFHMLVADELPGGRIRRVTTEKVTLRLGEQVAHAGRLGSDVRDRAIATITDLLGHAREAGAERVVTVATDALRSAADSAKLRDAVAELHGLKIRLLEGHEEGELSLRGMQGALPLEADEKVLGLDLGGGSYELAFGGSSGDVDVVSLPIGPAKLSERLTRDPPRLVERAALHDDVIPIVREAFDAMPGAKGARAAGTAGTIRDLGRIALSLAGGVAPAKVRGLVVTRDQLERGYARLVSVPTLERMDLPGLKLKRADLLPAGGIVLLATMEVFGLSRLELCDWGLREGALMDVIGPRRVLSKDLLVDLKA